MRSINWDSELCSPVACAGSPTYSYTLIEQHDMGAGNDSMSSYNCLFDRLLNGWLRDLEKWRDIHAFKSSACALPQVCRRKSSQRQRLAISALNYLSRYKTTGIN